MNIEISRNVARLVARPLWAGKRSLIVTGSLVMALK